jgi:UDP-N-acetylmuramyl pentapeptide phosphotransferase/UDP-N-acetylglucosamine-1-phosphate transferase
MDTLGFYLKEFRLGIMSFVTAFVVAMLAMPLFIKLLQRLRLFDEPNSRKLHATPTPTMGGVIIFLAMAITCSLWFTFSRDLFTVTFFFSLVVLLILGVLDDLHNISATNKLVIQLSIALLITFSGVRITSLNGLLGIYDLPIVAQYALTVVAITGVTNAFNLIDGIDGLAGGIGFLSLLMLGNFLTASDEPNFALLAYSLAGALIGFLYYNMNPARIFMGDTGSLVLGFVIAVLTVLLIQVNTGSSRPLSAHAPIYGLSIVLIPVFDTLRVFTLRLYRGVSPFSPDKTHIHHLLTNNHWTHRFTNKLICTLHCAILVLAYFLKDLPQEIGLLVLGGFMFAMVFVLKRLKPPHHVSRLKRAA